MSGKQKSALVRQNEQWQRKTKLRQRRPKLSSEENASDWLQMKSHSKKEMNTLNKNHKISP
jgi:hypothetical protein